jgi:Tfp pilus assembly major pilin PilA
MLIELLIVAAIMVVLPSILLPVFAHAHENEMVQFFVALISG